MRRGFAILIVAACGGRTSVAPPPGHGSAPAPDAAAIEQLALSASGACGVLGNGGARCWGEWDGALVRVGAPAGELRDVLELRIGHDGLADPQRFFDHLCARDRSGGVRCWGNDRQGQLGAPDVRAADGSMTPELVAGIANVEQLALGARHACARDAHGDVWCWGQNRYGQCGAGSGVDTVARAARVSGIAGATEIVATHESTCARTEGVVRCWGQNQNGQARAADALEQPIAWDAREVAAAHGAVALAAGDNAVCALDAAGAITCWGFVRDLLGEAYAEKSVGRVEGLPGPAQAIAMGDSHVCAIVDGAVWCEGTDRQGQLGDAARSNRWSAPIAIALPGRATTIVAGGEDTCARLADRRWICWGGNLHGELAAGGARPLPPTPLDLARVELASE